MKTMNRAIEDVSDFQEFRDRLCQTTGHKQFLKADSGDRRFAAVPQRQLGENRATYRARVKADRRAAKQVNT